jgi:RHS repeat-associated protein
VSGTFSFTAYGTLASSSGSATTPFLYAGAYYDSVSGQYYLVNRTYDPTTGAFVTVDPLVGITGQPYAYTGDDPVNETDSMGLVASSWWRDIVDVPQDAAYLEYWGSYEAIKAVNGLANYCGPVSAVCSAATHSLTSPLVPFEAIGLGEDALSNLAKGETIWQEGVQDQPLFGNETGGRQLSQWVGCELGSQVPTHMDFPGLNYNHTINFAW